ncbi:MAG TPA: hypothetical protein VK644_01745 [Chitinophagaceae bacterium]|nr:hypothetical protein [Chitinophagaceae bacterium]
MKKLLLLSLAVGALMTSRAQDKELLITKSLSSETIRNVKVETSGGAISVTGGAAADARVEVYVRANSNRKPTKEELQAQLNERYDLEISVANNKLTCIAKPKDRKMDWKKGLSISFRVYVTKEVATDLATSGGSIDLRNVNGEQDFRTSGGSLTVDQVSGNIKGRTSGGSIHLSNSKDDIDLATSGGSIEAKNCEGKLRLTTSGGSVNLGQLKGNINATTSGGSVRGSDVDGDLSAFTSGGSVDLDNMKCNLEAGTSGGSVHVQITEMRKYCKLTNSGGHIDVSIPANKGVDLDISGGKIQTDKLTNFSGTVKDDQVNGKMNGGGMALTVNAGSGRVSLAIK